MVTIRLDLEGGITSEIEKKSITIHDLLDIIEFFVKKNMDAKNDIVRSLINIAEILEIEIKSKDYVIEIYPPLSKFNSQSKLVDCYILIEDTLVASD